MTMEISSDLPGDVGTLLVQAAELFQHQNQSTHPDTLKKEWLFACSSAYSIVFSPDSHRANVLPTPSSYSNQYPSSLSPHSLADVPFTFQSPVESPFHFMENDDLSQILDSAPDVKQNQRILDRKKCRRCRLDKQKVKSSRMR